MHLDGLLIKCQTSDMVLMVLDATKRAEQRYLLETELEAVGIRLNQDPPNIYLKQKKAGGMKITFQSPPKNLDEKMLYNILRDYRILNCEVLVRDENGMNRLPAYYRQHADPQQQQPSTSSSTSL